MKVNRRMVSSNFLMSTYLAALCELGGTGISRRLPWLCHLCAPQGCSAGGCWMLSWEAGLQRFCFFCQKSPHEPDMNTVELPAKHGDMWPSQRLGQPEHSCGLNWKSEAMDDGSLSQSQTDPKAELSAPQAVTTCLACILHLPFLAKGGWR